MKHCLNCCLVFTQLLYLPAIAAESPVDRLQWLAGCWSAGGDFGDSPEGSSEAAETTAEYWLPPAGGVMLGLGRTLRGGRLLQYEFLRIEADASGRLRYLALPSGQQYTVFTEAGGGRRDIVFENPAHDFPQRIAYSLNADGILEVNVSGSREEPSRGFGLRFSRVGCDASFAP